MSYSFTLLGMDALADEQRRGVRAMKKVVYPPEQFADDPVRSREWRAPQWGVLVTDDPGSVVSYTGIVIVQGAVNGEPSLIGGVGGIATHPEHRGRGLASRAIDLALAHMASNEVDFAILVCRDQLVAYYEKLGWRLFTGTTWNRQNGEIEEFTFNRVMVIDVNTGAPDSGTIDVAGPLW